MLEQVLILIKCGLLSDGCNDNNINWVKTMFYLQGTYTFNSDYNETEGEFAFHNELRIQCPIRKCTFTGMLNVTRTGPLIKTCSLALSWGAEVK